MMLIKVILCNLIYGIQNSLQRLLGYLILFVPCAFVLQRQFVHKRLPSPLPVLLVSKDFISPPTILTSTSHISNSSVSGTIKSLCTPSRYPIYLIKMNNTRLPCLTATAGTRFSRDLWI